MSWAADGQEGNGLHFEKLGLISPSKNSKTLIMVYFLFDNSLDIFFLVFYTYSMSCSYLMQF